MVDVADSMVAAALDSLAVARPVPYWLDDPARPEAAPPLAGEARTQLAIVGGGYTGLWAAIEAKERDPGREVVLLEGDRVGSGASGRNGGFLCSSLTHGLEEGIIRFPSEIEGIERQSMENFREIREAIGRYGIDAEYEETPTVMLARARHELASFAESAEAYRRFGYGADVLAGQEAQTIVRSPVVVGALVVRGGNALVHPAKLAWGLREVALRLGVCIHENSPVEAIAKEGGGLRLSTPSGTVVAGRVLLATNAFRPLVRSIRRYVVPVYDHALMTEPLSAEQRDAIGWHRRESLEDAANRFHYFRLTSDDRILWGGYDATYHFGGRVEPRFEQDRGALARLARSFYQTFPALDGIRFTHRWGGVIGSTSRFSAMFGNAYGNRLVYVGGYTGLGVGASRFGARTALDLSDGLDTERTRLEMVRHRPLPFPPEPLRWLAIHATVRAYDRTDRTGREGLWLKALGKVGVGFQS